MSIWEALILGIVQGFTEFLPVSSSGHLVLLQRVFNIGGDVVAFDILLHLASLTAVIVVLRREIFALIRRPFSSPVYKLIAATVPTVIIVVLFKDFFESAFTGGYLGFGFLLTAVFLLVTDICVSRKVVYLRQPELTYAQAITMGVAQGLAILPGISRSGTTIFAGTVTGCDKTQAAKFSFLMSIPIIIASAAVKLPDLGGGGISAPALIAGFAAALISAFLSVKFMLAITKKHSFTVFVVYLTLLGAFTLLNEYIFFLF